MKILMLKTTKGSNDGAHLFPLVEGQEYEVGREVSQSLADNLLRGKLAKKVRVEAPKPKAKPKAKAAPVAKMTGPTENK